MYICPDVMKLMQAHLDGELDVKESLRVQTHLQECPSCRDHFVSEHAFQDLVQRNASPPPAPEFARQCLSVALAREARQRRPARSRWPSPTVFAALGAVAVALLWFVFAWSFSTPVPGLVQLAVDQHRAYLDHPDSLDVTSDDVRAVATWLEHTLKFDTGLSAEPVADLRLVGARALADGDRRAAYLVYRLGDDTVSLLMTPPQDVRVSSRDVIAFKNILFHPADVDGYHTLQWSDNRHTYVLVSDQPKAVTNGCVICHSSSQSRNTIAGFQEGI
jgi:anti-sigma factor RsiW